MSWDIRSIADTIAEVAVQISSLVPYGVKVVAVNEATRGGTFKLGPDPLPGQFTATVTAGDLPAWPAVLADCTKTAGVKLPDFHSKRVPLTWGSIVASGPPLLAAAGSAHTNDITNDSGEATWAFSTSSDPGDPNGEQQNQFDYMPVTVFRPEIAEARQRLTSALLGQIPGLIRPYVAAIFAPYLDGIQARLNAILDARGRGAALLIYHAPVKPTPTPAATPVASAACPNPLPPGTYTGELNTSSETIKSRPIGHPHQDQGTVRCVIVAGDGSVTGTWGWTAEFVYDADVAGLKHHHESTQVMTGGKVSGTACDLVVVSGKSRFTRCVDSLAGDCLHNTSNPGRPTRAQHLGQPTSSDAGTVHLEDPIRRSRRRPDQLVQDLRSAVPDPAPRSARLDRRPDAHTGEPIQPSGRSRRRHEALKRLTSGPVTPSPWPPAHAGGRSGHRPEVARSLVGRTAHSDEQRTIAHNASAASFTRSRCISGPHRNAGRPSSQGVTLPEPVVTYLRVRDGAACVRDGLAQLASPTGAAPRA